MKLENIINALRKPVLVGSILGCLYGGVGEFMFSTDTEREEAYYQKRSEYKKMFDKEVEEVKAIEDLESKKAREESEGRIKNSISKKTQKMHEEKIEDLRTKQDLIFKELSELEAISSQLPKIYFYPFIPSFVTASFLSGGEIDFNLNPKISFILSGKPPETHKPEVYLINSLLWAGIGMGIGSGIKIRKKVREKFRKETLRKTLREMSLEKVLNTLKKPVSIGVMLGCLYGGIGGWVCEKAINNYIFYLAEQDKRYSLTVFDFFSLPAGMTNCFLRGMIYKSNDLLDLTPRYEFYPINSAIWAGIGGGAVCGAKKIRNKFKKK